MRIPSPLLFNLSSHYPAPGPWPPTPCEAPMKILVIGLDAATMELIEPWADAGHLPTLARLMQEGASGRLVSTPNMHSASAWTSILTGLRAMAGDQTFTLTTRMRRGAEVT